MLGAMGVSPWQRPGHITAFLPSVFSSLPLPLLRGQQKPLAQTRNCAVPS